MRLLTARRIPNGLQLGLIVAAALGSIIAGATYLAYDSPFSPLIVGGIILGILTALIWARMPVSVLYTALLIVLFPTGLIPASIQSNLNRFLTVIALVVWGGYVIVRRRRIIWTSTTLFMLGFLVWCLLTFLWSQNLEASMYALGGYALRFVLFLLLTTNEINTQETLDGLMYTLAIAGWVFVVAGTATLLSYGYEVGTRLQILESNENTLGGLFPLVAFGVIWLAIRPNNPHKTLWFALSLIFFVLSFVLIAFSGSRGGAITWVITVLVLLLWRQTRRWGVIGSLILVAAIISAPFVLSTTVERFTDRVGDTLLGGREALWRVAWMLIRDRPVTGVGVGNAPYAMMSYVRMFRSVGEGNRATIHNPLLTVWVETGLPGILLYLSVLASSVWSFVRQYGRFRRLSDQTLMPYFALATSAFLGYFASWIKGGGMELSHSYFLMLAIFLIPSCLTTTFTDREQLAPNLLKV